MQTPVSPFSAALPLQRSGRGAWVGDTALVAGRQEEGGVAPPRPAARASYPVSMCCLSVTSTQFATHACPDSPVHDIILLYLFVIFLYIIQV